MLPMTHKYYGELFYPDPDVCDVSDVIFVAGMKRVIIGNIVFDHTSSPLHISVVDALYHCKVLIYKQCLAGIGTLNLPSVFELLDHYAEGGEDGRRDVTAYLYKYIQELDDPPCIFFPNTKEADASQYPCMIEEDPNFYPITYMDSIADVISRKPDINLVP